MQDPGGHAQREPGRRSSAAGTTAWPRPSTWRKAGLEADRARTRADVGGGAVTASSIRASAARRSSHHTSLRSDVARDMELARHGSSCSRPQRDVFAPSLDGPPLVLHDDPRQTADHPARQRDATPRRIRRIATAIERVASVSWRSTAAAAPPPIIDHPGAARPLEPARDGAGGSARSGNGTAIGCCAGGRCRSPTDARMVRDRNCSAPRSPRPAVSGTMLGPRRRAARSCCCCAKRTGCCAGGTGASRGGPGALTQAHGGRGHAPPAPRSAPATRVERIVVHERARRRRQRGRTSSTADARRARPSIRRRRFSD